ncbi:MAG: acetyl-CoA carboxylase biotin carboxyl carrier protein [Nitrospirae bacterium]|nr:acetyl-CoA carboxylase biotin carboxyl carrier protein [Nitrospirota bacterium]
MRSEHRKEIEELVEILSQENLTEIEVERKDVRIRIRRELPSLSSSNPHPVVSSDTGKSSEVVVGTPVGESSRFLTVTSPIVGTFYRAPSPEADPYVEEGDLVKKGQVICIVEAMKLMNEIESETDGRVVKILIESGAAVEYGQPLYLIDPTTLA